MNQWHEREKNFNMKLKESYERYDIFRKNTKIDPTYQMVIEELNAELTFLAYEFIDFYHYFEDEHNLSILQVKIMLAKSIIAKVELFKLIGDVRISNHIKVTVNSITFNNDYTRIYQKLHNDIKEKKLTELSQEERKELAKQEIRTNLMLNLSFFRFYDMNALAANYSSNYDMHISKILAKLFGADNEITTIYSNLIQNQELEEEAFISISPLDFLTMSENSYNWKSCLRIHGEYSGGGLSYILDNSTMISFLGKYNNDFPALDKKWRQLVYVQGREDSLVIAQSRQYPDEMNGVEKEISKMLFDAINNIIGENVPHTHLSYIDEEISEDSDFLHYYDLRSTHTGYYIKYPNNIKKLIENEGVVGAEARCLGCGEIMDSNEYVRGYVCDSCSE